MFCETGGGAKQKKTVSVSEYRLVSVILRFYKSSTSWIGVSPSRVTPVQLPSTSDRIPSSRVVRNSLARETGSGRLCTSCEGTEEFFFFSIFITEYSMCGSSEGYTRKNCPNCKKLGKNSHFPLAFYFIIWYTNRARQLRDINILLHTQRSLCRWSAWRICKKKALWRCTTEGGNNHGNHFHETTA